MKRLLLLLTLVATLTACGSSRVGYPCNAGESSAVTGCTARGAANARKFEAAVHDRTGAPAVVSRARDRSPFSR